MLILTAIMLKKKKGSVIVKPKSSIKANPILVKFSGAIFISVKDKEVIPLFQSSKSLPINDGKSKVLEAKTYSFPFEFVVPDNLPSAMDVSLMLYLVTGGSC